MKRIYLKVEGMSCQGCVNSVTNVLENISGIRKVDVELVPGLAQVICEDNLSVNTLINSINDKTAYKAFFDKIEEI